MDDYAALNKTQGVMISIDTTHPSAMRLLPMASYRPPLNDVRVRKAILYAIDTETIIKTAMAGLALPMKGIFPPGVFQGLPGPYATIYTRDLVKARALMQQAGYSMDKPVKMVVTINQEPASDRFYQVIQSQLKDIGINLELQDVTAIEWAAEE